MQMNRFHLIGLRLIICFLAAFDININGHWYLLNKALVSPMFYLAFAISFGICYLLLYIIHIVNINLNEKFPWTNGRLRRLLRQLSDGILLPAAIDLVLIVIYYTATGRTSLLNQHFYYEYRRVVHFIAAINLLYIIVFYVLRSKTKKEVKKEILTIRHNGVDMNLDAIAEILYVYKDRRNIQVVTISGQVYSKRETLNAFIKEYGECGFFQVNPSAIVNLHMVSGADNGTRAKTIEPLFKAQFQAYIPQADLEKLAVTRKYISNFRKELKKRRTGDVQI